MRTLLNSSLAAASALMLAAGPAIAQGDNPNNGGRKVAATLTGTGIVPGGDPDGAGLFEARVNPGTERICYTITASSIAASTGAFLVANAGGNNVLTFDTPDADDDDSEDCQDIDRSLALELVQAPENYSVRVDSGSGSIRGQLKKGS